MKYWNGYSWKEHVIYEEWVMEQILRFRVVSGSHELIIHTTHPERTRKCYCNQLSPLSLRGGDICGACETTSHEHASVEDATDEQYEMALRGVIA